MRKRGDELMPSKELMIIEKLLFEFIKERAEHYRNIDLDVSGSDIISNDEICIFIDCPTKREDVSDEVYFHFLKIFEIECKEFINFLNNALPKELLLTPTFYDIHEHGEHGEELYYSCGLICKIKEDE